MMVAVNITTTFPQVIAKLKTLGDDLAGKVLGSAMNRTIEQGRTAMHRAITSEFAIKASDVREQLIVYKVRLGRKAVKAQASLEAFPKRRGHRSRNVMLFSARQIAGRKKKRVRFPTPRGWITRDVPVGGGVSVKIKRAGGRKLIKGAFIGNKGRTVFTRRPGTGRKIFAVETIDVPSMFNTKRINVSVIRLIKERFPVIFEREARYFIERYSKG